LSTVGIDARHVLPHDSYLINLARERTKGRGKG
jgi:endonuclease IV